MWCQIGHIPLRIEGVQTRVVHRVELPAPSNVNLELRVVNLGLHVCPELFTPKPSGEWRRETSLWETTTSTTQGPSNPQSKVNIRRF